MANGSLCRQCEDLQMLADRKNGDTLALANARFAVNQSHDPFIHKFPPEIASEIFVSYLPGPDDDPWAKVEISGPLILGAVSRKWRQIAWSTPQLWSTIMLELYFKGCDIPLRRALVREWLSRSGGLPLDIHLRTPRRIPDGVLFYFYSLIDTINTYSSRWRVLRIHAPASFLSRLNQGTTIAPGSSLLELNIEPEEGKDIWPGVVDLRSVTSRLQQLTVRSMKISSLLVHFGSLTHLTTDGIADDECLEVMQSATNLVVCTFQRMHVGTPFVDGLVTCLKLQQFEIEPDENEFLDEFFNKIHLPALEILSVMDRFRHPDTTIFNLTDFFERCRCPLTHLTLGNSESEPQNMKTMLVQVPTLKHLRFRAREDWNKALRDVLQALADRYSSADSKNGGRITFLPYLEHLTCWDSARTFEWDLIPKIFGVDFENMHSIGSADIVPRSPLRSVHLELRERDTSTVDQDTILRCQHLVWVGIKLYVYPRIFDEPQARRNRST
ncbi:unnamed protein product [Cyclocybe aegerita]|uniref:F-box domain-containing protein n=1 Tax=Cyclocybe aegerita TaxID=1973307 RepID=A0A8S0WCK7_CYCAE|nr:unnamed protein product [Cyclocybe aegerita]